MLAPFIGGEALGEIGILVGITRSGAASAGSATAQTRQSASSRAVAIIEDGAAGSLRFLRGGLFGFLLLDHESGEENAQFV